MNKLIKITLSAGPTILVIATALELMNVVNRDTGNYLRWFGLILLVIGILVWLGKKVFENYSLSISIDFYKIERDDINNLIRLSKKEIGESPSRNEVKAVLDIRNDLVITQNHTYNFYGLKYTSLTGFYSLFPLKEKAVKGLETEELSVRQFDNDHIASKGQDYEAIYIGGIVSKGFGYPIVNYLKGVVTKEKEKGVTIVYTRPVTDIGLKLAKKTGFKPVDDKLKKDELERVYKLKI